MTLGFAVVGKAKPMTLLKGNELHADKAQHLELVLRKTHEECNFSEIIVGNKATLREYKENLGSLVSESLYKNE